MKKREDRRQVESTTDHGIDGTFAAVPDPEGTNIGLTHEVVITHLSEPFMRKSIVVHRVGHQTLTAAAIRVKNRTGPRRFGMK